MPQKKSSVIILIPYFGKLPWYFAYFLLTCQQNPSIDFLIFCDDTSYDHTLPANVKTQHITFHQFKERLAGKLELDLKFTNTYKLCDFKPTYGYVLSDFLVGYDFWGFGDIDVIFGDIRNFITDDVLSSNDVITIRHDFLAGYFTLIRNTEEYNKLFMKSRDYIMVLSGEQHYCFDECNFAFWKMTDIIRFEDVECPIESMTHVVKRLQKENGLRAYFNIHAIEGINGKLRWENGKLYYRNKYEIILYHLIKFKKVYQEDYRRKIPDKFRISPTRIY